MYKKYHYLCEDAKKIREDVFIKEQGFSNEFDETDKFATHLVFYEEETPIGVCRYFKGERNLEYVIGRIAVQKESRGKHFGKWIIETAEDNIRKEGGKIVTLSAQLRVQSFYEKMPLRLPVPIKVPIVSKVSDKLNENIVINTGGNFDASLNNDISPSFVNIAPNVEGRAATASDKLTESPIFVKPKGIPIIAVTTIPINIAPFMLRINNTTVIIKPITANIAVTSPAVNPEIAGTTWDPGMEPPIATSAPVSLLNFKIFAFLNPM